jgi:hypothetical protein
MLVSSVPTRASTGQRGSAAAWFLALLVLGGVAFAVYWFVLRKPGSTRHRRARVLPAGRSVARPARLVGDPDARALANARGRRGCDRGRAR